MADKQKKVVVPVNPKNNEPGTSVSDDQMGVQMAQNPRVNPPDERIPAAENVEQNVEQLKDVDEQEKGTGMTTTDGYVVDEAGRLDNYAVEPEMYVEK